MRIMKTYGQTACPKCGTLNNMYRPLDIVKRIPVWNDLTCFQCGYFYRHTDKINNVTTEAERVRKEGNF